MTRIARLLAAVALVALPILATTTPASAAPPNAAPPNDEAPVAVDVSTLLPRAPQVGGAFEVAGTLTNIGDKPVSALRVRLKLGSRIDNRTELDRTDRDRPPTTFAVEVAPASAELAPGQRTTFDLRTRTRDLPLGNPGVYPLDVVARGVFGPDRGRADLGVAPTYLPWFNGESVRPTRVAVLWPLVDQPRSGPRDVLVDDDLATSLAGPGRLGQLLASARAAETGQCDGVAHGPAAPAAPGSASTPPAPPAPTTPAKPKARCEAVPVTYGVDPDLLLTAQNMTRPYAVQAGNKTRPGVGGPAASSWLASLRAAASHGPVLSLPFGDPDVDALTRGAAGKNDVAAARDLGLRTTTEVLRTTPNEALAWPPAGPVTPAATDALAVSRTSALVLDPSALPPEQVAGPTLGTRARLPLSSLGTPLTGLVVDTKLSDLLAGSPSTGAGARLAEQRFLVETAIIAAERPSSPPRTLLVAPARRGAIAAAVATAGLHDLGRLPWVCPVSLPAVAAASERCAGEPATEPSGPTGPIPERGAPLVDSRTELPQTYLSGVAQDRADGDQLVDAVLMPSDATSTLKASLRRAAARAESSAWRTDPAGGQAMAALLHDEVAGLQGRVQVRGQRLLLTSSKGTLSVSVDNLLPVPVTLKVRFLSATATLSTQETPAFEVPAGTSYKPSVRAQARRSGRFVVFAQLIDREGRPFGSRTEIDVRSTRYGRIALAVTGVGAGVLFVAAGTRIVRRARSSAAVPAHSDRGGSSPDRA